MWWYNILGDNEGSTSHILRLDPINSGFVLLTVTEWMKFIYYFGQSIEADPSRVVKDKRYSVHIIYIPITSSVKLHISRRRMDKHFDL